MNKKYVAPAKAYRKLQFAAGGNTAVYLFGATGYGKTKLVQEYLTGKGAIWLSPFDYEWDISAIEGSKDKTSIVVVDDLQNLKDEEQKQLLIKLATQKNVWLILIGRMHTPLWLVPLITSGQLVVVSEEDLHLTEDEVKRIAANEGVQFNDEVAYATAIEGHGNAYVAMAVIQMMKAGEDFSADLQKNIKRVFIEHLEKNIIPQWSTELQEFLMKVSVVDSFTLPLAVTITGDNRASAMLEQALGAGNFLQREGDTYILRPMLALALRSRALKVLGVEKYNRCINNAALYYEMQNDFASALKLYEQSGNKDGIFSLLVRSARQHPGSNNFYDLRRYYLSLDESEIETNPLLMSVMSMLYSVMMNTEKSEYWYAKLKNFAATVKGGQRREADEQLLYLDIGLPHRGSVNLLDLFKHAASLIKSGGLTLPELSLTNNQPSIMNGGKDFCEWSKRDAYLADTVGKLIERLMGDFGHGLIHAALCESLYEKGGHDNDVMGHAIMMQMDVERGGKTELMFASVGIQVRLNLMNGNAANAIKLLDSFETRVRSEKLMNLLPNLNALRCRVALVTDNYEYVNQWMQEAPDEQMEFWSLDRYRYLTKVRCYLALGQNQDAINLLKRLLYYADVNKRTYIRMESKLLMGMAMRQENQDWKPVMLEALNEIQGYNFVRIITEKAAGILPLLKEINKAYAAQDGADPEWFKQVLAETKILAERYPGYLLSDAAQRKDFSETALKILKMQADGYSIKEIAENLDMAERTVKYHAAENYRKLNAKGKTDAVQIARSLNLI